MNVTTNATITTAPSSSAPLIGVDAVGSFCSLCPNGLPLPDPDRRFINVPDDALSCGGLDQLFYLLETEEECKETMLAFDGTFNPSIYCRCPEVEPTGICSLCSENDGVVVNPDRIINNALCSDYGQLSAAATTIEFCQSILDVEGIQEACCQVNNVTMPEDLSPGVTKAETQQAQAEKAAMSFSGGKTWTTNAQQLLGVGLVSLLLLSY